MVCEWWDLIGKFKLFYKFNLVCFIYIKQEVCWQFDCDLNVMDVFKGLCVFDIGCGGGLLSELMVWFGVDVVGVDVLEMNIEIVKLYMQESGFKIDYWVEMVEVFVEVGEIFDVVFNMEVVEYVVDVLLFLDVISWMVCLGGLMFVVIINWILKVYVFVIVGVEYVLCWLLKGIYFYDKFVKFFEIEVLLNVVGFEIIDWNGVIYNLLSDCWDCSWDMDVNYMLFVKWLKVVI